MFAEITATRQDFSRLHLTHGLHRLRDAGVELTMSVEACFLVVVSINASHEYLKLFEARGSCRFHLPLVEGMPRAMSDMWGHGCRLILCHTNLMM